MLSIGTKKYRNLQEQVAYNTECIKKLDDYLDGITIEDKLVVIESDSGTFTDEELVILSGPLAFISNGSRVWMKDSETLIEFVYKAIDIKATEVGSAYFEIGGSKIVVNRETGAYNTSSDTIITTYSKSQIDSIIANVMAVKADKSELTAGLALKANIAGQAFSGPVTAPSIIEDMSGYALMTNALQTNLEMNILYAGAVKNGNKLTLVLFCDMTRSGAISPSYLDYKVAFDVPRSVGDKISTYSLSGFDMADNKKISFYSAYNTSLENDSFLSKSNVGANTTRFWLFIYGLNNLTENTKYYFRYEVTFLLSDSLAS